MMARRATPLPFAPPSIGEGEIADVVATLRSGWLSTGPRAAQFEREFAAFTGAPTALALNSGTAGLHLALVVLGIGVGDSVIVPTLAFSSAAHVVEHVGAHPILFDVEPARLTLDLDRLEELLGTERASRNIRAVMPVHLYGQACDLRRLDALATRYAVHIIEDAAHALPSYAGDVMVGSSRLRSAGGPANLTAFSFYATKNITTGEGGMLTGPPGLIEQARELSLHGMTRDAHARYTSGGSWRYDVTAPGFKYNLSDVQAALGIRQLARLPVLHARRRAIAQRYDLAFSSLPEIQSFPIGEERGHAWHLYVIRLCLDRLAIDRARFIEELGALNIGTSVHFIPIHTLTYYREKYGYARDDFPVASREFDRLVSLPIYPDLTSEDVDDVIKAVISVVERNRR
jgi:dTDP-4-amino-4,6-dideoxygalactose transaminase